MSVVKRSTLEASPLADLHVLAGTLSIDDYRRLRKADLVSAILERQGAADEASGPAEPADATKPARRPRRRRAATAETAKEEGSSTLEDKRSAAASPAPADEPAKRSARPRRATSSTGSSSEAPRGEADAGEVTDGKGVAGVVELRMCPPPRTVTSTSQLPRRDAASWCPAIACLGRPGLRGAPSATHR